MLFLLLTAACTDWKRGRIYNLQIAAGLCLGAYAAVYQGFLGKPSLMGTFDLTVFAGAFLPFLVRFAGICMVFFPLFLWRMMGAGDIKLMAVCVGILGFSDGIFMVFLSLSFAAIAAAGKMCRTGTLWVRMEKLAAFLVGAGRGESKKYQTRYQKEDVIHLGPFLFWGYCLFLFLYGG